MLGEHFRTEEHPTSQNSSRLTQHPSLLQQISAFKYRSAKLLQGVPESGHGTSLVDYRRWDLTSMLPIASKRFHSLWTEALLAELFWFSHQN